MYDSAFNLQLIDKNGISHILVRKSRMSAKIEEEKHEEKKLLFIIWRVRKNYWNYKSASRGSWDIGEIQRREWEK